MNETKTSGLYGVWFAFLEYPVKLIGETPGAYFSKVPRTFRAREARVQTAIHFFWKADLLPCFLCKRIAKFDGLEPRRCEDVKGIVAPEIGRKNVGTFRPQE